MPGPPLETRRQSQMRRASATAIPLAKLADKPQAMGIWNENVSCQNGSVLEILIFPWHTAADAYRREKTFLQMN
jgi:hypothetical protein